MKGLGTLLALLAAGCASNPWERHDTSLYTAIREPSPESYVAHAQVLKQIIDQAEAAGRRPPGGICAEYAWYCTRLGRRDEARAALEKEARYYPQARTFLVAFERFLQAVTPVPQAAPPGAGRPGTGAPESGKEES